MASQFSTHNHKLEAASAQVKETKELKSKLNQERSEKAKAKYEKAQAEKELRLKAELKEQEELAKNKTEDNNA